MSSHHHYHAADKGGLPVYRFRTNDTFWDNNATEPYVIVLVFGANISGADASIVENAYASTYGVCRSDTYTYALSSVFSETTATVYTKQTDQPREEVRDDNVFRRVPVDRRRFQVQAVADCSSQCEDERTLTVSAFLKYSGSSLPTHVNFEKVPDITLVVIREVSGREASARTLIFLACERFGMRDDNRDLTRTRVCFYCDDNAENLEIEDIVMRGSKNGERHDAMVKMFPPSKLQYLDGSVWYDLVYESAHMILHPRASSVVYALCDFERNLANKMFFGSIEKMASFRAHYTLRYLIISNHLSEMFKVCRVFDCPFVVPGDGEEKQLVCVACAARAACEHIRCEPWYFSNDIWQSLSAA
jgi:hypothetical protein